MTIILQQPTAPSTLTFRPHHDVVQNPSRHPLRHIAYGPNIGREDRITTWLKGTSGNTPSGPQHPRTPPLRSSDVTSVNSMLAPSQGSLLAGSSDNHNYYQPVPPRQASPRVLATSEYQPRNVAADDGGKDDTNEANQIVTYLQIPSSINSSKGSLSEFAAQITCLFWFESSATLKAVEESTATPAPKTPLVEEAKPSISYRKWVTTLLSTTQVSQNVILLALMFIYRLKTLNPTVKGKAGSEYRLLTVALMLGNKFLDDNTYTNKTWADVSGICVSEIHVMEVEFLSNMRYTLYASEQEWDIWHRKLGRFWDYFDRASRTVAETRPPTLPATTNHGQIALPSPPASQHASPPFGPLYSKNGPNQFVHPFSTTPYLPMTVNHQMQRVSDIDPRASTRKRSHDDAIDEPYAKRLSRTPSTPQYRDNTPSLTNSATSSQWSDIPTPKLPLPNFSNPANGQRTSYIGPRSAQLPPPSRAMSTIYNQGPQRLQPTELSTPNHQIPPLGLRIPPMNEQPQPHLPNIPQMCSRSSSPTSVLTPTSNELLSPANYSFQRLSPYRPVRGVNTLLVPPPSASLHNPMHNIGLNSMHYQPLGRPLSERKTGVVPFLSHESRPSWAPLPNQYQYRV